MGTVNDNQLYGKRRSKHVTTHIAPQSMQAQLTGGGGDWSGGGGEGGGLSGGGGCRQFNRTNQEGANMPLKRRARKA